MDAVSKTPIERNKRRDSALRTPRENSEINDTP